MKKENIVLQLKEIVALLSAGELKIVYENDICKRIPVSDILVALDQYPGKLTYPPMDAFEQLDIYVVSEKEVRVDFDLWYDGGKSDLTLCCSFYEKDNKIDFCLDDIRVL